MAEVTDLITVVIGETGVHLYAVFVDNNGNPVNITGATSLRFQATSETLAKELDVAGVEFDGAQGVAKFAELGGPNYLTLSDMGANPQAEYRWEAKCVDTAGKVRFSKPRGRILWQKPLLDED